MNDIQSYLMISSILFSLGVFGVVTKRNAIAILMGIELILNSANINFIAFNRFSGLNNLDEAFLIKHTGLKTNTSIFQIDLD